MATANTVSILTGLFKEVYADKLMELVPKASRLQQDAKYVSMEKREGNRYHQPVRLTRAHGWTLDTSGDAFALNQPEPARTQDATVQGSSFLLREVISYDAAAKLLQGSGEARKRAFVQGTAYMVENMTETASFVLELQLLHGQSNLGVIVARTDDSGTSQTFSFTAGSFIPAMWSGLEKGYVDVWDDDGSPQRNLSGTMQVTAVDVENREVTFLGVEAEMDTIAAGDYVYLRGTKSAGMVGLGTQISNTGLMFGINAADYSLWAGNTFSAASGSLSFAKAIQGLNKPTNRGLMSDVLMYCSPKSWTDCNNDLSALRRYADKAGGKIEQGSESIMYYGQTGSIELIPHIFMKPSEAFCVPKGKMIRLGASEVTFTPPGASSESFFENLPDHAGYGTRCYWNQALLLPCPSQGLLINNITNSDD